MAPGVRWYIHPRHGVQPKWSRFGFTSREAAEERLAEHGGLKRKLSPADLARIAKELAKLGEAR